MKTFDQTQSALPATGFLRIWHIVGDSKANPPIPALIPVSKNTFLKWVREGKAPAGILLSSRTRAWSVEKIHAFIEKLAHEGSTAAILAKGNQS